MVKQASLSIIEDTENHKFLMIKHLRGINKGFVNFCGGKMEEGETMDDCVRRETFEETGITIENPKRVGYVEFAPMGYNVTIYKSTKFHGTPHAREGEVELFWQDIDKIPFEKMRKGDEDYLTEILKGKYVKKRYTYDEKGDIVSIVPLILEEWEKQLQRQSQIFEKNT